MVPNRTSRTAEWWPGWQPAGTSPEITRGSGSTDQRTARRWRPRSRPSPWVPWRRGWRNCCPYVLCRNAQPRRPAATHAPTAPLTVEQLYVVAAALLADGGESFVHHHGPAQIAGSIQGPQRDAPDPWHA